MQRSDKFRTLLIDISHEAGMIGWDNVGLFKPNPAGWYYNGMPNPIFLDSQHYYTQETYERQPDVIPIDISTVPIQPIYDKDFNVVATPEMLRHFHSRYIRNPGVTTSAYDFVKKFVEHWLFKRQAYTEYTGEHESDFMRDMASCFIDPDKFQLGMFDDVMLRIDDILTQFEFDPWKLHFVSRNQTTLKIIEGQDFRIYDWNRIKDEEQSMSEYKSFELTESQWLSIQNQ